MNEKIVERHALLKAIIKYYKKNNEKEEKEFATRKTL